MVVVRDSSGEEMKQAASRVLTLGGGTQSHLEMEGLSRSLHLASWDQMETNIAPYKQYPRL